MPDVPRDPRQLARDILSGKVRIEDLARERQLRGGGGTPQRLPDRIPLPRPVQPTPRPPAQRAPVRQPPRPTPPPLQRRPVAFPSQPRKPQYTIPAPTPAPAPPPPRKAEAPPPEPLPGAKPAKRSFRLNELVRSQHALRQGILLAEVLGKPVSLRDD